MPQRGLLIVNADDVGHDVDATDGTLECFAAGRITSASAMVYMQDSDRASGLLREAGIPVGLHINLTEAFSDPATPPDVTSCQARLLRRFAPDGARRTMRWIYDPQIRRDVERCVSDQLQRFEDLYGRPPTHVDGHQHVHVCPNVFLARSLPSGIRMRGTLETYPLHRSAHALARALRDRVIKLRFPGTDYFFDISEVDPRRRFGLGRARLALAAHSAVEIMAHPRFAKERDCLMSPEWEDVLRQHSLGSFADLPAAEPTALAAQRS